MTDEIELTTQGNPFLITLIEYETHHLRQFQDRILSLLGVDIHQCMDIIKCVHEEVRIDLVPQVFQLLLQVLLLQCHELFGIMT